MRSTDPGLAAIRQALEDYDLTTPGPDATAAGRAEQIAEHLAAAGYVLRRLGPRRLFPAGAARTWWSAYAGAAVALAVAIVLSSAWLWAPALLLVLLAAWLMDRGRHYRALRARAQEAEVQALRGRLHEAALCQAGAVGLFGYPVGPCVLRYGHGPVHQDANGTTWSHTDRQVTP
jgi:hypothetical protein